MKLLTLLHALNKSDWHWLTKFAASPVHNRHAAVSKLLEWLRKHWPVAEQKLTNAQIHQAALPDTVFDAAKAHHVTNYLLRTTEDFLAWEEWYNNTTDREYYLLQAHRRRKLDRPFHEVLARLRRYREAQPLRHATHYRFNYLLALEAYQHTMQTARSTAEQLQALSDWHDAAFVAEKLRNACILVSRRRLLPTDFDLGLLSAALEFVRQRPTLLQIPAIAAYYYGYLTLIEPQEDAHFFNLKKLLPEANNQFPEGELRDLYMLAINFCIPRINLRQEQWLREVFELYKNGLENRILLENNQLTRFTYTNIALAALRLQEFAWTYTFLQDFREYLPEIHRNSTFSFNLARFYCEKGDFDRAMPLLSAMDFDDISHNLTAKAMLLRMYYETGSFDALESLLISLSTYLRRKRQVGEQQRLAYSNLIKMVRKLISLSPKDRSSREQLRIEIVETPLLAEKDWLTRMVER